MNNSLNELERAGVVPVINIATARDAVPLAESLLHGGLPVLEITFRTNAASEAIRRIATELPAVTLGAGTVVTLDQAKEAVRAGARFIVSPGFSPQIVDWCMEQDVLIVPGVATPTEIMLALSRGLQVLKFFPAEESGGVLMLKALAGPFPSIRFVPTGGITAATLPEYLRLENVLAVGGSWIATSQLIAAGQFSQIRQLTAEACAMVRHVRAPLRNR